VRGQGLGRAHKVTPHQGKEALARKMNGEPVREIERTCNVSHSTIPRLLTVG
jgi:hypothetical protein